MIDISIIIVNYNTKQILLQCLESLYRENKRCFLEIIVVDNASTDGSPEAVEQKFPNVIVIRNEKNLGFSRANNIGIMHCKGQYLCLVNSDIEVLSDCLEQMYCYMEDHNSIGILGPKILNPDLSLRVNCKTFPNLWKTFCRSLALNKIFPTSELFSDVLMTYFPHDVIRSVDVVPGCFLMVRREAMDKVGLLDENFFIYAEDKDWCRRFRTAGWDVVFFPYAEVIHYAGKSAAAAPVRFLIERLKSNSYYWGKYHSRPAQIMYSGLLLLHYLIRTLGALVASIVKPSQKLKYLSQLQGNAACSHWLIVHTASKIIRCK